MSELAYSETAVVPIPYQVAPDAIPQSVNDLWLPDIIESGVHVFEHLNDYTYTSDFYAERTSWGEDEFYREVNLVDMDREGVVQGYGELWVYPNDVPCVGYTETLYGFSRQGLGIRRLQIMNCVAEMATGILLHSAPEGNTSPSAKGVWEKLVQQGAAEQYQDEYGLRYRFQVSSLHR